MFGRSLKLVEGLLAVALLLFAARVLYFAMLADGLRTGPGGAASGMRLGVPSSLMPPAVPLPSALEASVTPPAPQLRRASVGVFAGPERANVYFEGQLVGQTPFIGSVECEQGKPLHIEVVGPEPSAKPLRFERRCAEEVRVAAEDRP